VLAEKKQKGKKRKEKAMRKRIFAAFVCLCMLMALVPSMAYANDTVYTGGLCEHHTQHDGACGYTKGTAEIPCSHEHNESCGGLTDPAACNHTHDEACGYVPATEGTPCTFVCEVCNPQDNGNPEALSDAQPEESTCETLCTGEEINADCPVRSAEGAELDKVCVGVASMLPVTALAVDEPATLYVGNQQVIRGTETTYWGTNNSGELTQSAENNAWNVKYDPSTATLTLKGAKISGSYHKDNNPYTAGIYAQGSSKQPVALTIELIGTNTITGTYGIFLNAEIDASSYGTNATLTITGENNGSLGVSGSGHGIYVKSGTGNASLTITNASVDAETTQTNSGYAGVCVQSSANATGSPNISLAVNGGSLTASGTESGDGIQFFVGSHQATGATTNLTVTDNAIVDARNGGISASRTSVTLPTPTPTGNNSSGIVFDDKNGTVYGNVELQEDITINEGETLTVGKDASLTIPDGKTLTNNGTVTTEEGGTLTGNITDAPPKITTANLPDGTVGEPYTETTLAVTGDAPISWQLANGSTLPAGLNLSEEGKISGTPTTANIYKFTVTATNDNGSDSKEFTLSINGKTKYSLTVNLNGGNGATIGGEYTEDEVINIDAGTRSGYRFAGWTSSDNITFANAGSAQTTFTMPAKDTTITANWKKKSSGGSVFFWDLKFDTNGGSKIDTVTEWEYSTIDLDEYVPEKEGYKFVGWYADEDLTKKIDEVYLTQDTTVYAKWEKIEEEVSEEPEEVEEVEETETISFLDVKESDWFYEAVSYAVENGLMSGMSEDIFAPNTPLTREMLAVVLYNVEGQPESAGVNPFTDVKADIWYTDAILWANENGIVAGYDNSAYGVGDLITREQFATILYRYAQFKGYDTTQGGMAVREFSDYENISDYARPAMAWAVNAGIMGGMDDGTLMPQGKATRAEAATMLMNFCENIVEK
jgi:uncharacterized repeat protein (TIGR02543 family)